MYFHEGCLSSSVDGPLVYVPLEAALVRRTLADEVWFLSRMAGHMYMTTISARQGMDQLVPADYAYA